MKQSIIINGTLVLQSEKFQDECTMLLDAGCLSYRKTNQKRTMSIYNPSWTLSNPAVIYIQPRERFTTNINQNKVSSHNSINISPDFSQFNGSNKTNPGNIESRKTLISNSALTSPLPIRQPKYVDYEEVLKQIEEDHTQSSEYFVSSSSSVASSIDSDNKNQEDFIDIPLKSEEFEKTREELQTKGDDSKILSKFFDRLLVNVYPHICKCGTCKYCENINRRRSDSKLVEMNKVNQDSNLLHRQHSYCHGLEASNIYIHDKVLEIEGFKRSQPYNLEKIAATTPVFKPYKEEELQKIEIEDLQNIICKIMDHVDTVANNLRNELNLKEKHLGEQDDLCDTITLKLREIADKTSEDSHVKFSLSPVTQDQSGFAEWARAMRMVARLPDGVPAHFRKNLWLSLAERHLNNKGVTNWAQTERRLFSDYSNLEDRELSVQIVKDLHRTGCSLFCGVTGKHNQAVLKRVLLAYARWNKSVGYCQGLNMLAALILQVMQGSQSATVKVMIYLIEGVLPESYFANNLRGLSVDMAVFRDLLKLKLPELSRHLDHLQQDSKDSGTSYEPPLCDVFTMQWFLTIFSNCLPQATVLRVWDLMFLEGDQILLRTALAIWQSLSERMMSVRSADEFYSIMAVLTREMMEFGLMEPNSLIKAVDNMNIPEIGDLREKYVYSISPWTVSTVARRGLKLFYPDPYEQEQSTSYDSSDMGNEPKMTPFSNHPDREKIALDITALKKQYCRLKERQRQAHIILSACRGESLGNSSSPALNHLLLGKRALLSMKGRRIEGAVPPDVAQQKTTPPTRRGQTLHWRDAEKKWRWTERSNRSSRSPSPYSSSTSSSSTELCDDSSDSDEAPASPLPNDDPEPTSRLSTIEANLTELQSSSLTTYDQPENIDSSKLPPIRNNQEVEEEEESIIKTKQPTSSNSPTNQPTSTKSSTESSPLPSLTSRTSPSPTKSSSHTTTRRDSEMALLQILQENSEILQRIQSHSFANTSSAAPTAATTATVTPSVPITSSTVAHVPFEEPEDIKEIRRKYERISAQSSQETH